MSSGNLGLNCVFESKRSITGTLTVETRNGYKQELENFEKGQQLVE